MKVLLRDPRLSEKVCSFKGLTTLTMSFVVDKLMCKSHVKKLSELSFLDCDYTLDSASIATLLSYVCILATQ